jgi:hypothetical protein
MPGWSGLSRWRFLISPKWVAWHLFVAATVAGMAALGDWQLHRALSGNALSWAYTFEWPLFAIFGVVFWVKTILDEVRPPAARPAGPDVVLPAGGRQPVGAAAVGPGTAPGGAPGGEEDEELAAYNAYLARLHREVRGHGRWHGLR